MEPINEVEVKLMLGEKDIQIAQLIKEVNRLKALMPKEPKVEVP